MADDLPDWNELVPTQQSAQSAAPESDVPDWSELVPTQQGPEPEGPIKSAFREAAHGVIPAIAGGAGAIFGGAAFGIPGAIGGGIAGAGAASEAQKALLKGMGYDDSAQRAANAATNPTSADVGAAAPLAIPFGGAASLTVKLATRLLTGTITGGLDVASQAVQKGEVNPTEAIIAAGTGALLPNARPWLGRAEAAGTALGERLMGRTAAPETAIPEEPSVTPPPPDKTPLQSPADIAASQTSGALSGRPPAPGEGGAVAPNKAIPTPEEAAAVTNTPQVTPQGAGAAQPHDPDVQARTIPASQQSGDGFVAVQTPRDQSTGFNEKKTRTPRAGIVETVPSTPVDNSSLGADVEQTIKGVWGARPESFTEKNIKQMGQLPVTPPPPEGMVLPPKGPPGTPPVEPPSPRDVAAQQAVGLSDQGLLEVSKLQREGAEKGAAQRAAEQQGEAFQDLPEWNELVPAKGEHEITTPQTPEKIEAAKQQSAGNFTIPEDNSIPDFLKRSKPGEQPPPTSQAMMRGNMPKNLSEATQRLRDALGIKSTPAADEAINAGTPEGQAPRVTQNAIEAWVKKNPIAKAINDHISVRGSLTPPGEASAASIMKFEARADQNVDRAGIALEPLNQLANTLPPDQQLQFQQALEGGQPFSYLGKGMDDLIDAVGKIHKDAMDRMQQANLLNAKDYLAKFWPDQFDNPGMAKKLLDEWDQKTPPTIADAMKAGLKLKEANPIVATINHAKAAENWAALNHVIEEGMDPKSEFGAFVREADERLPTDVQLEAPGLRGHVLYADPDWARNFNHHYSKLGPFYGSDLYQGYRRASNLATQIQLLGPMFHAITETGEAMIAKVASSVQTAARGDFAKALGKLKEVPGAPYTYTKINAELKKAWLGEGGVSPRVQRIADLIRDSGGRIMGYRHDPTLEFGPAGPDFFKGWSRGYLRSQIENARAAVTEPWHQATTPEGVMKAVKESGAAAGTEAFRLFGQTMRTIGKPMFEWYIPAIKNGVMFEHINDFINAHPNATDAEIMKYGRKAVQSTDNRFGEMISDNIFWSNNAKALAQGLLRAYSWFLGTVGEIGGGGAKLATTAMSNPSQLRNVIANDPRAAYVLGFIATNMVLAATYQYLKTGKGPEGPRDLILGRTGGTLKSGSPERAILPGYLKDVLGWAVHPGQEARGKLAVLPQTIWEIATNRDWRDDPIADENAPALTQMKQYLGHALQNMEPIYAQQAGEKAKPRSNVTLPERLANIRPTSVLEERNPAKEKAIQRAWTIKQNHDKQNR